MEKPLYATKSLYQVMTDCWNEDPTDRPTFSYLSTSLLEMISEMERNRLEELSDIYTNLLETDQTTNYLPRMVHTNLLDATFEQTESRCSSSILLENLKGSQCGPEPTCLISGNTSRRVSATFSNVQSSQENV